MAATIMDVQIAINNGDRQEAARLLQEVLRKSPSADAWYAAAQLTRKRDERIRHLRRALTYDANHKQALRMLTEMGAERKGNAGDLFADVGQSLSDEGERSLLVRWLPKPLRGPIIVLLMVGIVVAIVYSIVNVVNVFQPTTIPDDITPIAAQNSSFSANALEQALRSNSITISSFVAVETEEIELGSLYRLSFLSSSGSLSNAQVLVFNSSGSRLLASEYIDTLEANNNLITRSNIVIAYPKDLPQADAARLQRAVDSLS